MDQNPKQQVAEKLRSSANVLVTVSKNPSVDQLAAAIGLSLMLNSLGKHVATVFSGQIPDIISFLEPEKTFEDTVDGLRDFIISLDKEKADKLRYKVEDDVVKIFITPYRTKITDADLKFEQGDFNVDAVVALGVKKKADLDEAITAHGRILHDATVIAVNTGEEKTDVASISWGDENASSLCEMLVSISEALEGGILDEAMSTAFLTGIVSVTERFSNQMTTPKLMTMSAQLMAAGANQQLISEKLNVSAGGLKADKKDSQPKKEDGLMLDLSHDDSSKDQKPKDKEQKIDKSSDSGDEPKKKEQDKKEEVSLEDASDEFKLDELEKQLQDATEKPKEPKAKSPKPDTEDEKPKKQDDNRPDNDNKPEGGQGAPLPQPEPPKEEDDNEIHIDESGELKNVKAQSHLDGKDVEPPTLGGTFNATSTQAHKEKKIEQEDMQNSALLDHSETEATGKAPRELDDARAAVHAAMEQGAFDPANNPLQSMGAQPLSETKAPVPQPATPPQPQAQQPPQQQPMQQAPPAGPPPVAPPLPPAPASLPPVQQQNPAPSPQMMPQPQQLVGPPAQPQQTPFTPVMNTSNPAQTFNLPGQRAGMPPDQALQQAQQPPQQQPLPPNDYNQQRMSDPNLPPPPAMDSSIPPPPQ